VVNAAGCSSSSGSGTVLDVAAGSELKDMQPILDDLARTTGIQVKIHPVGSLDGAEQVAAGTAGDAAWFASDKYIALAGAANKVLTSQPIAISPVIVGVRHDTVARLGWTNLDRVGWRDIASAAGAGKFHYAMTNPTASNSGFSALVGVATTLSGGQALSPSTIDAAGLKNFFSGQALTSGSSGFLADAFVGSQDRLDGMINYESVLMGLNQSGMLHQPLDLVYPKEGTVTADYPLMLLNPSKRDVFNRAVAYLRLPAVQARIERLTSRRPAVPGVTLDSRFGTRLVIESPFPGNLSLVQQLLDDYQNNLRRPAHTIYVLDTSGSMGDQSTPDSQATGQTRIERLKAALVGLAGGDASLSGHFTRFAPREKVTLIPFASSVKDNQTFAIDSSSGDSPGVVALRDYINGLSADGGTAIYSAVQQAYALANQERASEPDAYTSIVLMTDGENNQGISSDQFLQSFHQLPADSQQIRVFTVLFGEASPTELQDIAAATGGRVFDARSTPLSQVFKEIRGYQ
jgi:Ca-activated chloride channel family protein